MFESRGINRDIYFASLRGLAENEEFIELAKRVLNTLETVYEYPVDIEYTINFGENKSFVFNLLQCRPLQICTESEIIDLPDIKKDSTLFLIEKSAMGRSRNEDVDVIVLVDAYEYYNYPYNKKVEVANIIGTINNYYKNTNMNMMLIVPGRIGTSSPELGVPVKFSDISEFDIICELEYSKAGYSPELSFGSHMFQDLVEADILYCAIEENHKTISYQPDILNNKDNLIRKIIPQYKAYESMIKVYELYETEFIVSHDMSLEKTIAGFVTKDTPY